MPSAIPAKLPKQSSTTTSQSGDPGGYSNTIMASDAGPVIAAIENKIRNLEKRKAKLVRIEEDLKKGKEVTKDQKEAASHIGEVEQQLEAMKELLKTANDGVKQQLKQKKQERKAEQKERVQNEIARIRELLQIQDVLSVFGNDDVRKDFSEGNNGALKLTDDELQKYDELYKKLCPTHEDLAADQSWGSYLQDSSLIAYSILTNSTNAAPFFEGKTYRDLHTMLGTIVNCGYFENKYGRSQSPEQAKSEAASTISNPEESARTTGEKHEESAASVGQQQQGGGAASFNGGGNGTVSASGGAQTSPPRQVASPSTLLGQGGGQPNISFLQDDQSGGGAYGANAGNFEASAINSSMPFTSDGMAFVGGYTPGPAVMYSQQPGYGMPFDSTLIGGGQEQMIQLKQQLDPNAPTFVSQADTSIFTPTIGSTIITTAPMHQDPNVAQFFNPATANDQRLSQEPAGGDENVADGQNDGFVTQHGQEGRDGRYFGRGGGRGGGGYRGGDRGGYTGRGGGYRGGGYRGGRQDGGQGHWGGHDGGQGGYGYGGGRGGGGGGGYRGRGGGGGYRNDDQGGGGRGRGGGRGNRGQGGFNRGSGGGGFEHRGGRGGGGGGPRAGGGGGPGGAEA